MDVVQISSAADQPPHLTNISFGFVEGESLMMGIGDIACSSGSACTSASLESFVLKSLGVGDELAHSSLRISSDAGPPKVDYAAGEIIQTVKHLRSMSPLYDLHNEGIDITTIERRAHWRSGRSSIIPSSYESTPEGP